MKLLDWGEDGKATSAETAALRAAFQQEVSVWHKLDHPNVTKVNISHTLIVFPTCYKNISFNYEYTLRPFLKFHDDPTIFLTALFSLFCDILNLIPFI